MVCCQNMFGLCIIHSYFETVHISTIIIISINIHNNNNNNNTYYIIIYHPDYSANNDHY